MAKPIHEGVATRKYPSGPRAHYPNGFRAEKRAPFARVPPRELVWKRRDYDDDALFAADALALAVKRHKSNKRYWESAERAPLGLAKTLLLVMSRQNRRDAVDVLKLVKELRELPYAVGNDMRSMVQS